MTIPTNLGTGGPDLQSAVDGSSEHYQGVVAVGGLEGIGKGAVILPPTDVVVNVATSGDNTLLAAQGVGKIIHVLSGVLIASDAVAIEFRSDAAGTALTGPMALVGSTGFSIPHAPIGQFRTAPNQALVLNLSASVQLSGWLVCVVE